MAASSTAAAFLVALKTALQARFAAHGTLSNVRVDLIPTGDTSAIDVVTLIRSTITGGQEWMTMGNRRQDSYQIPGVIFTYATGPDSDVTFQASWDKAALILDELILQLRDTPPLVGDTSQKAMVSTVTYEPLLREQGGWVTKCEFTVEYGTIVS
jgi:hypothetical protein